ncbi:MAG: S24/S26 family peptidase [Clostridia bacterium]|nr:S24/S26 family peptidase [Clostridia bacterium]
MNKSSFEEILKDEGRLVYSNVGTSMQPLIRQGRDLLIIERTAGRLKKYDVPLYRRANGQYVLHRIIKVRPDDYVLRGDNQLYREKGVTDGQILGVLTAVVRDGKEILVTATSYRIYVRIWCVLFPVRALFLICAAALRRLKKQIRKKS